MDNVSLKPFAEKSSEEKRHPVHFRNLRGGRETASLLTDHSMHRIPHLFLVAIFLAPSFTLTAEAPRDYIAARLATLEPENVIVYKKIGGRELKLRLFLPESWAGMAPTRMDPVAADFAKHHGNFSSL